MAKIAQVHTALLVREPARPLTLGCTLQGFGFKSGQESMAWIEGKICILCYHYTCERETGGIAYLLMQVPINIYFLIKGLAV